MEHPPRGSSVQFYFWFHKDLMPQTSSASPRFSRRTAIARSTSFSAIPSIFHQTKLPCRLAIWSQVCCPSDEPCAGCHIWWHYFWRHETSLGVFHEDLARCCRHFERITDSCLYQLQSCPGRANRFLKDSGPILHVLSIIPLTQGHGKWTTGWWRRRRRKRGR